MNATANLSSQVSAFSKEFSSRTCADITLSDAYRAGPSAAPRNTPVDKVSLERGKSFPVSCSERIIIGPVEDTKENFPDLLTTKVPLVKRIYPVQYKMKVSRNSLGPRCSTVI